MTDDDRMDRARRIRELREGGRSDETDESDDQLAESDGGNSSSGDTDTGEDSSVRDQNTSEDRDIPAPSMNDTATEPTDVTETLAEDQSGINAPLPGADELEDALDAAGADSTAETVGPAVDQEETQESEEETRVLEFTLDGEHFCLDIEYIEEIVKKDTITRVPNTPAFVEGVVDLRGQITTILNPKVILEKEDTDAGELIIVFDDESFDDQGNVGWVVDDVRQVSPITQSDVNDPPMADDHINGVIDRDDEDEFVIWTTPELTMQDEAEG